jgi:hypothetical protein
MPICDGAHDAVAFQHQVVHGLLEQPQVGLVLQARADRRLVQAVGLGAGGAHGRALGGVQDAELDARLVGGDRHRPTHGIDFLDQVALADPADGGIAGHLAQGFDVVRQQQGFLAHACCGQCSFGAGVTAANDNDVKLCGE